MVKLGKFLSTPSARRATAGESVRRTYLWISIHALREEGDVYHRGRSRGVYQISIHALREEGDPCKYRVGSTLKIISIHALREEGDLRGA